MTLKQGCAQDSFYKEQVLAHWSLINRLASARFTRECVSEAAALYVVNALAADNWNRVRKFNGKATFRTYLSSVVYRLLEDYSRKQYGRKKVPRWIRDMGGIWLSLFLLLCFERFPFTEAIMIALDRRSDLKSKAVEEIAEKIISEVPDCGEQQHQETVFEDHVAVEAAAGFCSKQQEEIENRQKELFAGALFQELLGQGRDEVSEAAARKLLKQPVDLSDEERLLLKLCHRDGVGITEAGRMTGLTRYQVHGKMRRLYKRIRRSFEEAGCEEELRLLLDG